MISLYLFFIITIDQTNSIHTMYDITKYALSEIWSNKYHASSVNTDVIDWANAKIAIDLGIFSDFKSIENQIIINTAIKVIINDVTEISQKIKNAKIIESILFILSYGINVDILSIVYDFWIITVLINHAIHINVNNIIWNTVILDRSKNQILNKTIDINTTELYDNRLNNSSEALYVRACFQNIIAAEFKNVAIIA